MGKKKRKKRKQTTRYVGPDNGFVHINNFKCPKCNGDMYINGNKPMCAKCFYVPRNWGDKNGV